MVVTLTKPKAKKLLFENCLISSEEYQKEERHLNELRQQRRRLEMQISFDAIEKVSVEAKNQAVDRICAGESVNAINSAEMVSDREICIRKIRLLGEAISKKEQALNRKRGEIWKEVMHDPEYNRLFGEAWGDLLNEMESFRQALIKLENLRQNFECTGVEETYWPPAWKLDQTWYNRIGIFRDGSGPFLELIKIKQKAWGKNYE